MRKTVLAALPLTLLALAVPAAAQAKGKPTSYRATIAPLAAAPSDGASASRHASRRERRAAVSGVHGQARLSDGDRRDRVRLTVRGLERGQSYTWSLRKAAAGGDACTGEVVDAFEYGTLRRRHPHDSDRSRDFAVEADAVYAVVVTAADGTDVACGTFADKAADGGKKGGKGRDKAGAEDVSDDDSADAEDESGDDDSADDHEDESADDDEAGDDDSPESDDHDDRGGDDF
jgi:hypothetical protein